MIKIISLKMTYGNCVNYFPFPLDLFLLDVGDNEEVVAVEFFGGFDEGIEFALAGFLGGHVVTDLDQLLNFCASARNEVNLFIIAGAVVEHGVPRLVATAQQLDKHLVF